MVPTQDWVVKNFFMYRTKYFGYELPTPKLIVSDNCQFNGQDCFGYYDLFGVKYNKINRKIISLRNYGTICISSKYDRPEQDIIGTLLHEMIHEYVNVCLLKYPKDPHGKEFMDVAQRINADGWNISESNEMGNGFVAGGQGNPTNGQQNGGILCVIYKPNGTDYKFWVCRAEANQFDEIRQTVSSWGESASAYFYQTQSQKLLSIEANPKTLPGFGSMNINDAINKLVKFLGEDPNIFIPNNIQKL